MIQIAVRGEPLAKQSARFAKRGKFMVSYQPKKIVDWKAQARLQIINQLPEGFKPLQGPVIISNLKFLFNPLKSFNKKTKEKIANGGLVYKRTKPDLDNLQKQINDVCNGLLFNDDAQIVEVSNMVKAYAETPMISFDIDEVIE